VFKFSSLTVSVVLAALGATGQLHARSGMQEASWNGGAVVPVTASMDGLSALGQASLTWLGIRIYDATLWTEQGSFHPWEYDQKLALRIDYHRNIDSARLAETTRKEWRKLEEELDLPEEARRNEWLAQAEALWPDVKPGDYLVTVVEPGGACRFYSPDGLLGVIEDPEFGPAFLSIWLHPQTSRPDLRAGLIGVPGSEG
jgi:glycine/D-amino acid oxidase-like deaminating enzyme